MNLSRRDFTKLSAIGLAAQIAPKLPAQSPSPATDRKVGYAIIGLGRIADHFMRGTRDTSNSKVVALVSGHPDKAARIAEQYGVKKSSIYNYENMDSFRDNHEIEAVYVALPNSMHAEYTIRSAKAGKNVLCEKPMAVSVSEAQSMIDACKAANVKLMIAYRCHYETTNLAAVKLIRDGAIGQIQQIQSAFGFSCGPAEWRLQKPLAGGGPLMDVGIYCLNACRHLTGEEPVEIKGYSSVVDQDGRFKEVEENVSWCMKFPSGAVASCSTTYGANMTSYFRVLGSKGELIVEPAFPYDGQRLVARVAGEPPIDEPSTLRDPGCFVRLADHFAECIFSNREPGPNGAEGLRDMKLIAAIYKG